VLNHGTEGGICFYLDVIATLSFYFFFSLSVCLFNTIVSNSVYHYATFSGYAWIF